MLKWAAIFFVIAIIAAVLGFSGLAAGAAEIAKVLFFVFILVLVSTLIMGMMRRESRLCSTPSPGLLCCSSSRR